MNKMVTSTKFKSWTFPNIFGGGGGGGGVVGPHSPKMVHSDFDHTYSVLIERSENDPFPIK